MEKILFQEEQKNDQRWLIIVLLISMFAAITPFVYGIYSQEVLHVPFGDKPASTGTLVAIGIGVIAVIAAVNYLIIKMTLKVKITSDALWVSFPPLIRKWRKITPSMIERYEFRTYNAHREFGGHGIKRKARRGSAFTISGKEGLQLYFTNGKKLLIGTQKKQAFEYAMKKLMETEIRSYE